MKSLSSLISTALRSLAGAGVLFCALAAGAQTANLGSIEGRVFDSGSGKYLEKARLTIQGSAQETFTDSTGNYRFARVPAGAVQLEVFYTGLPAQTVTVNVTAGQAAVADVTLTPHQTGTVQMSEFVVSTSKEMEGAAIAINEQRFAPNIIHVVSADEFGTIAEGSVGEFMKFLPGVTIGYEQGDASTISLNGVSSNYVPVTLGGFSLAGTNMPTTGRSPTLRTVDLGQVSMNSVARVEVAYSPTPESKGGSLVGSVNLVPRSAFEYAKPVFSWSAFAMTRAESLSIKKQPGQMGRQMRMIFPGFNFSYLNPVNKRFGFTLSGGYSEQLTARSVVQARGRGTELATTGTAYPNTTFNTPYLSEFLVNDNFRLTKRASLGATADFKISANDSLYFSFQYAQIDTEIDSPQTSFVINTVNPLGGYSATHTYSTVGGAVIRKSGGFYITDGATFSPSLTYRHNGPIWRAVVGAGYSHSAGNIKDAAQTGYFGATTLERTGVTIKFDDKSYLKPERITVTDSTGVPIDPHKLSSYLLTQLNNNSTQSVDVRSNIFANVRRDFYGQIPLSLKAGLEIDAQMKDVRGENPQYLFAGKDGVRNTADDNAGVFLDEVNSQRKPSLEGYPQTESPSPSKMWDLYTTNPAYFQFNEVSQHNNAVSRSKHAAETIAAAYFRGDAQLLKGRLKLVGGLRVEQTEVKGEGRLLDPTRNFQYDANGNVLLAPNGSKLLINPAGSIGAVRLTTIDRGLKTNKEYLRWFPSLNASYQIRDNVVARGAYYRSIGRPVFDQYAGGITLPDIESPPAANNRMSVNNVGIKAWSARTTKVSVEHYFERVGVFSIGAFQREFENFFGTTVFQPTPEFLSLYGIDHDAYGAYEVSTQYNMPDPITMIGLEFNYKQVLTFLPHWARGVTVFANGNRQRVSKGDGTNRISGFVPHSANWGISLTRDRYSVGVGWNYRGRLEGSTRTGLSIEPGTQDWTLARMTADVNASFRLYKTFTLYVNLRDVSNEPEYIEIYGPSTPANMRFRSRTTHGSLWTLGVKGTF